MNAYTMPAFRIQASARYLIGVNVSAFFFGTVILVFLSFFRLLLSPLAVVSIIFVLALCLGREIAAWYLHGARSILLDSDALRIELGKNRELRNIPREDLKKIQIKRFLGEGRVVIDLRPTDRPGSPRSRPGREARITIRGNAFRKEEFEKLLDALSRWRLISLDSQGRK
jgi:hypothetical protein